MTIATITTTAMTIVMMRVMLLMALLYPPALPGKPDRYTRPNAGKANTPERTLQPRRCVVGSGLDAVTAVGPYVGPPTHDPVDGDHSEIVGGPSLDAEVVEPGMLAG